MKKTQPLSLHEEIMLLALRDEKGTIAAAASYQYILGAALLCELLLRERVNIDPSSGKKKLIDLVDGGRTGDDLLDECLSRIKEAKRRASLKKWVQRFGGLKGIKHRVARQLCRRGILRLEEDKVLLVFTRKLYPELDPRPERELVERLRRAIFKERGAIEPKTAALVALAHQGEVLKNVFEKKKLRENKTRIKQIVDGELTAKAAKEAMDAVAAAIVTTVVVGTAAR